MVLTNLRNKIANVVNESGLTVDAIYFVLKDVYAEIDALYNQQINRELAAAEVSSEHIEVESGEAAPAADKIDA